jgi:hypothetical protein
MDFRQYTYSTTFPEYGAGPNGDLLDDFHMRVYMDNFEFASPGSPVHFNPNKKNRRIDEWLDEKHRKGIKVIWSANGKLDGQNVQGTPNKVMPIDDRLDAENPDNWSDYAELCRQIAIRYSSDATGERANVFKHPSNSFFSSPDLVAADTLYAIQLGNEVNFLKEWSKASRTITPEEAAACFYAGYFAIREESQTLKIIAGSILSTSVSWLTRFLDRFNNLCLMRRGESMPKDFYLSWHWYMREGNQTQSREDDIGASPEFVKCWELLRAIDDLCVSRGILGHYCTETGWADSDDDNSIKQAAPLQEGYTLQESVALMHIRFNLIAGTMPLYQGTCIWAPADGYDGWPYWFCGLHYKRTDPTKNPWNNPHPAVGIVDDWRPKPQKDMIVGFGQQYRGWDIVKNSFYFTENNEYYVEMDPGTGPVKLGWSDGTVSGLLDPMPSPVSVPKPTPDPTPTPDPAPGSDKLLVTKIDNFIGDGVSVTFDPPMIIHLKKDTDA